MTSAWSGDGTLRGQLNATDERILILDTLTGDVIEMGLADRRALTDP